VTDSGFPLDPATARAVAHALVRQRWPDAVGAWLAGSVAAGRATATSDLDVVVLLDGPPAPFRESLVVTHEEYRIPVELFAHTVDSVRHYVAKDRARSQPTMARMVSDGVPLLAVSDAVAELVALCRDDVVRGPDPLQQSQIDAARYAVTDLLEDLRGAGAADERAVLAATLWEARCSRATGWAAWPVGRLSPRGRRALPRPRPGSRPRSRVRPTSRSDHR
jgi:predicted nucleotidyltransferase